MNPLLRFLDRAARGVPPRPAPDAPPVPVDPYDAMADELVRAASVLLTDPGSLLRSAPKLAACFTASLSAGPDPAADPAAVARLRALTGAIAGHRDATVADALDAIDTDPSSLLHHDPRAALASILLADVHRVRDGWNAYGDQLTRPLVLAILTGQPTQLPPTRKAVP